MSLNQKEPEASFRRAKWSIRLSSKMLMQVVGVIILITLLTLQLFSSKTTTFYMQVRPKTSPSQLSVSSNVFEGKKIRVFPLTLKRFSLPQSKWKTSSATISTSLVEISCRKWGVVTTINEPTAAILNFAAMPGWCLVVVGDMKTPTPFNLNSSMEKVYFLGQNTSEEIGFCKMFSTFCAGVPDNSFGRKNLGYLYAITKGATAIWDFDDDNILTGNVPELFVDKWTTVLKYVERNSPKCHLFNPYPHMGGPLGQDMPSWPRGIPLDSILQPCQGIKMRDLTGPNSSSYIPRVGVVQSLANRDPDVDAIYRLTRGTPFDFDPGAQDWLLLGQGIMAPYNAQATLFTKDALWTLLLPMSVHPRVADIWRSYIAQRLMWDAGLHLVFAPPHVDQLRNPHNYLGDLKAEDALYHQATALTQFLDQWQGSANSLAGRMEELVLALYERGYIEISDVQMWQNWIASLFSTGYEFPSILVSANDTAQKDPPRTISKVAVCVRGNNRYVENADNLMDSIVNPLNADVFLVVQGGSDNSTIAHIMSPVASFYEDFSINEIVAELKSEGFNKSFWDTVKHKNSLGHSAMFQYKAMKICQELIENFERDSRGGTPYEWVVVVRSDSWCMDQPFPLSKPAIYISAGHDFSGYQDRMIAMPRQASSTVLKGSWQKLTRNTNTDDSFSSNTETAHKKNVFAALSSAGLDERTGIVRSPNRCFISCVPGLSHTRSSFSCQSLASNDTQAKGYKYSEEYKTALQNTIQ